MSNQFIANLLKKKTPDEIINESSNSGLKKTLSAFDLIILGIGAVVGTGIFTIVGIAAQGGPGGVAAGPALVISMLVAAIACFFSALCYSEFASMMPTAGSSYSYTYATMGEFAAWMVGWILMLEYAIGNIAVASAWTGYFFHFLKGFPFLPEWLLNPPMWLINDYRSAIAICEQNGLDPHTQIPYLFDKIPVAINIPAIVIVVLVSLVLVKGVRESARWAGVMVAINLTVIMTFVIAGMFYVKPDNWTPFAPNGFEGVFMGAFIIFFAYIGFDAISTTAEETKNPQRDLPIGIIGTLLACTVLYVTVALVLTGMVPYQSIDFQAPLAHAMRLVGKDWIAFIISIGALAGLTSVLLIYQLGTTRILYAMSRDKFLPRSLQQLHPKFQTPALLTWITGIVVIIGALFMDIGISADLCNFGTFTSFIIVCIAVLILRKKDPHRVRPFKVPFAPWTPIIGVICCFGLMLCKLKTLSDSALLFPLWLIIGAGIYFMYGYRQNRLEELRVIARKRREEKKVQI